MPDSETVCGAPIALSKIISVPVCDVVLVGLKVTDTLHFLPGASSSWHSDFTTNTDGGAVSISMLTARPFFFLPTFLIVTVLGLLVVPTVTSSPNFSE